MRATLICILLLVTTASWAQSKKELEAQIVKLKAEIENLKKPHEADLTNKHKRASYGIGVWMASTFRRQGADSLDVESIALGMSGVLQGKPLISEQECMAVIQPYMQGVIERKSARVKDESVAFLEANKSKEGVIVTASGLQYKIVTKGTGKSPGPTDKVTVNYTGTLIDGSVFDSSVSTGRPANFGCNEVIPGWTEALQLMHEGDKYMLYIPYQIGYGERGNGPRIPPFSTLVFELELLKVN